MASDVILSVGSNRSYEDAATAVEWLLTKLEDAKASSLYSTPAVQGYGRPYVNAVVAGKTALNADELNHSLKQYELQCGRDDQARRDGIVPVDIDIVVWNGEVIRTWDFRQNFFKIGYSELSGSVIEG